MVESRNEKKVRCTKCGYVGPYSEFPKGRDFFQHPFITSCPKGCGNSQGPGSASLRMMPGQPKPFEWADPDPKTDDPLLKTLSRAKEPS